MCKTIIIALMMAAGAISSLSAQKIFMLGDSHVFGKIYPEKTAQILNQTFPESQFEYWGKNGAEFVTYNQNPEYLNTLFDFRPEILIVHLGTNDSYGFSFDPTHFRRSMEVFCQTIREQLPDCKIVMVSPFMNKRWLNKKRTKWRVNTLTRQCSNVMKDFAASDSTLFFIDNNSAAADTFVGNYQLVRRDNVHLTEAGYNLLAIQVAQSLLAMPGLWQK